MRRLMLPFAWALSACACSLTPTLVKPVLPVPTAYPTQSGEGIGA